MYVYASIIGLCVRTSSSLSSAFRDSRDGFMHVFSFSVYVHTRAAPNVLRAAHAGFIPRRAPAYAHVADLHATRAFFPRRLPVYYAAAPHRDGTFEPMNRAVALPKLRKLRKHHTLVVCVMRITRMHVHHAPYMCVM